MVRVRKRGEEIRQYILENVESHPKKIVQFTSEKFGISRQAVNKHIKLLVKQQTILMHGTTKSRFYSLCPIKNQEKKYLLDGELQEDIVWREDVYPLLIEFPDNVIDIWNYCISEILNNAIDHSSGKNVIVQINKTAITTEIIIYDDGEGIFKKIQRELGLLDERHAILELSKGKLTTDPDRHTGEGIFFSSRMVDDFTILSGKTFFSHENREDIDWILEHQKFQNGTGVFMKMKNNTSRTVKKIFDKYTSDDDFGFTKTVVPVRLIQYGDEMLVSRSQAKRLLSRVERFKTVILDFDGVKSIGQAFADEVFRIFALKNRKINILHINANKDVEQMIVHVLLNK
jgi:anti-sigma regulatory factor (Ser/Thr protein kinase)